MAEEITSPSSPRIKALVRLRSRRTRDASGTFLIEGERELEQALEGGVSMQELYVCEAFAAAAGRPDLVARAEAAGAGIARVAETAFRKASYRDSPDGLLAVAAQFSTDLASLRVTDDPLYLIAEGIEKPGNVGAMLRVAAAAGVDGFLLAEPVTDLFNPNVVRSSLGALFVVPVAVAPSSAVLDWLDDRRVTPLAASTRGSTPLWDVDLTGPVALVVGSEQEGLSPLWLNRADPTVVIPTPGAMTSLNAAMAAGILLFEAVRQRNR